MAKTSKVSDTATTENSANPAPSAYEQRILATIAGWAKASVGFAPYLKLNGVGDCFFGKLAAVDNSNPEFPRYIIEALEAPIECQRGPVASPEQVTVEPGDFFTVSKYAGLPIERFLDIPAFYKIKSTRVVPGNENHKMATEMFEWDVMVSGESKKLLAKNQRDEMLMLRDVQRRTIEAGDVSSSRALATS